MTPLLKRGTVEVGRIGLDVFETCLNALHAQLYHLGAPWRISRLLSKELTSEFRGVGQLDEVVRQARRDDELGERG